MYTTIHIFEIRNNIDTDFVNKLTFASKDDQDLRQRVKGVLEKYLKNSEELNTNLNEILNENQRAQLLQFRVLLTATNLIDTGSGLSPTVREGSFHIIRREHQTFFVPLYLLAKAAQGEISDNDIEWFVRKIKEYKTQHDQTIRNDHLKKEFAHKNSLITLLNTKIDALNIISTDLTNKASSLEGRSAELKREYTDISRENIQQKQQIQNLKQDNTRLRNELKSLHPLCDKLEKELKQLKEKPSSN
jgi:DNA repair exonuclease SbcCD ATPase subunit